MRQYFQAKTIFLILAMAFLFVGTFHLIDSKENITGAYIGVSEHSGLYGLFFMILSLGLFLIVSVLKEQVSVSYDIKPALQKQLDWARRNERVRKSIDHLVSQMEKGSLDSGMGTKHVPGTSVSYQRDRNGGRVFYRTEKGKVVIVAESGKYNEQDVIDIVRKLYG